MNLVHFPRWCPGSVTHAYFWLQLSVQLTRLDANITCARFLVRKLSEIPLSATLGSLPSSHFQLRHFTLRARVRETQVCGRAEAFRCFSEEQQ